MNEDEYKILIVDPSTGPNKTIDQAIRKAKSKSIIRLTPGVYSQHIYIDKPNIIIEPKTTLSSNQSDIIFFIDRHSAIVVDYEGQEKSEIRGIKISHTAADRTQMLQQLLGNAEQIFGSFGKSDSKIEEGYNPDFQYLNKFSFNQKENSILFVKRGHIVIRDCTFLLNNLNKEQKASLPAIVVSENCSIDISKSLIKGSRQFNTIGLVCNLGKVSIRECQVEDHTRGGALIWGKHSTESFIMANNFSNIEQDAIVLLGQDFKPRVFSNTIAFSGTGIRVGIGCQAQICKNSVKKCNLGIETISCQSLISNNHIQGCTTYGITTSTYKKLRNDTRIKRNNCIGGCKLSGVLCSGLNNFTKIDYNYGIAYNGQAGIMVQQQAHVHIFKNKLMRNLKYGIFLIESASAIIERNQITENIQVNIALGGLNSVNCVIIENKILRSKGEGIYLVNAGRLWIFRNDIVQNNDGIVCQHSVPIIQRNYIVRNRSAGILVMDKSAPTIRQNLISENQSIGLFMRDYWQGDISENKIMGNEVQYVQIKQIANSRILEENSVQGEIRVPKRINLSCSLI